MSTIKILPEDLANKIAAGEVIERPASVVKEFVENGIDARAHNITVEVEGGGTRLVRVIDDGDGMDQDDVLLCLERHATSKLKEAADLDAISTLGFRGEAIPSIASVARLVITSKKSSAHLGTLAEVRYGQVRKVHEMGCGQGTSMEVRDLFGNVPARRKFLKTKRTELAHIEEVVVCAALAHPAVGFRYLVDGREILSFTEADTLEQRVATLFQQTRGNLLEISLQKQGSGGEIGVHGWLLAPDATSGYAARLRLFVLGRPVRDRMISHAVNEGGHGYYMKGKRPTGVIMVTLPLDQVDVNVHPTKQEIRFQQAAIIHQAVVAAVRCGLEGYQAQVKKNLFGVAPGSSGSRPALSLQTREPAPGGGSISSLSPTSLFTPKPTTGVRGVQEKAGVKTGMTVAPAVACRPKVVVEEQDSGITAVPEHNDLCHAEEGPSSTLGHIRYIGQYLHSYILCSGGDGLVIIDQHAAHERLLFEKLKKQLAGRAVVRQKLLFPEMMECTAAQIQALKNYGTEIAEMGMDVAEFGGDNFIIKAVPALLAHLGPLEIFSGMLDRYVAADLSSSRATRLEDIFAAMACKAAVKAHHPLHPEEGAALVQQMLAADVFSHCPHGRPVYRLFGPDEVKRWFKRT